jgi:hypothetical protein
MACWMGDMLFGWVGDVAVVEKPLLGGGGVAGDEEDFLDGAGGGVLAFDAGGGWVLDFEAGGCFAAADFDSAGDDAGDVGAVFDDAVEDLVEAVDPAVLAFDAAELHGRDCNGSAAGGVRATLCDIMRHFSHFY